MDVNFAFLCDYADNSAKLTAVGVGFDTLYAPKVPTRHGLFYAVISIRFSITEFGSHKVGLHLIDVDGNPQIPPLEATISVTQPPTGYLYRNQLIALALYGVGFARYGDYSVRWTVDGREVTSLPLKVVEPPKSPLSSSA
ncbi:MAG: hypothetical protein HY666_02050 [Chloroflexi bacterium]|nr:hypothetical protein [Chloroflexota bacterium]